MSKDLVNYVQTDLADLLREKESWEADKQQNAPGAPLIKLAEGRSVLRLLPARADSGSKVPFFRTWLHYVRNPYDANAKGRPVVCSLKSRRVPCPVCAERSRLLRTGTELDKQAADVLKAKQNTFANVVNMMEVDKGVHVWQFGQTIYDGLLSIMCPLVDPSIPAHLQEPAIDLSDPGPAGANIIVERKGTGKQDTKYTVRAAQARSAIENVEWLGQMHDLRSVVRVLSTEEIQAILSGEEAPSPDESVVPAGYLPPAR